MRWDSWFQLIRLSHLCWMFLPTVFHCAFQAVALLGATGVGSFHRISFYFLDGCMLSSLLLLGAGWLNSIGGPYMALHSK